MDDCHFSYIEKLKKTKTKEKPLLEAGTSSHGLVITGYCPLCSARHDNIGEHSLEFGLPHPLEFRCHV